MATNTFNRNVEITTEEKTVLGGVEKHVQMVGDFRVEIVKWENYGKSRLYIRVSHNGKKFAESFVDLKDAADLSFGLDNKSAVEAVIEVIAGLMPVKDVVEDVEMEIIEEGDNFVTLRFPFKYDAAVDEVASLSAFGVYLHGFQPGISCQLTCDRRDIQKMKYAVAYAHRNGDGWLEKAMIAFRAAEV